MSQEEKGQIICSHLSPTTYTKGTGVPKSQAVNDLGEPGDRSVAGEESKLVQRRMADEVREEGSRRIAQGLEPPLMPVDFIPR